MHGATWVGIIRKIPPALHDGLMLLLSTGAEVVVQRFLRLDRDYMVVRGRMSGAQDSGRVMVLPYVGIVNLAVTKRITEEEANNIFNKDPVQVQFAAVETPQGEQETFPTESAELGPVEQTPPPIEESPAPEPEMSAMNPDSGMATPVPTPGPGSSIKHPSKSILLARLRARLGTDVK